MNKKQDIKPKNDKGQPHGLCIYYHRNGKIWYKKRYANGIKHGIGERYDHDGKIWFKRYWDNGKCVYAEYYSTLLLSYKRIEFKI